MNEEEKTGKTVAQLLNQSLHDITPGVLYQLQAARRAALENYQPAEDILLHTGTGVLTHNGFHWLANHAGKLVLAISFLLLPVAHHFWQLNYKLEDKSATPHTLLHNDTPTESFNTGDPVDFTEEDDNTADTAPDETNAAAMDDNDDSIDSTDAASSSDSTNNNTKETNSSMAAAPASTCVTQDPDWMDESDDGTDSSCPETQSDSDKTTEDHQNSEETDDSRNGELPDTDVEDNNTPEIENSGEAATQEPD